MKCAFPKERLALHVEGDLPEEGAQITSKHVLECAECRRFLEQLHERQSLLKSLRRETMGPADFAGMRREVLSRIDASRRPLGWPVRIERWLFLGFRTPRYALAGLALLAIVSISLLAQRQHAVPETTTSSAVFEGGDALLRPERYRDWVLIGAGIGLGREASQHPAPNSVYINRSSYQQYAKTGKFPEGTVIVLERANAGDPPALQVSVKDGSRFDGGWGFYDFTDRVGAIKARALPDEIACRSCHEDRAETDHVFTQFYPILRSARAEPSPERMLVSARSAKC